MTTVDMSKYAKLQSAPSIPSASAVPPIGNTQPPPPNLAANKKDYCFELKLGESNTETYPEFSWKELIKEAQQKELAQKSASGKPVLNPYASDDDDDLKAMAARFEEKYNGGGVGTNRKRRRKAEDYIDRGAGYDEQDSFIDNSEIYDEIVPEDIQPVHGGFYINSGRLDFKEVEVSDCDVDEELEEQLQSKGRRSPNKNNKKNNTSTVEKPNPKSTQKFKKRKISTAVENEEGSSDPSKVTSRKNSVSPKGGDTSRSSSPMHPHPKSRKSTISSESDSSSSGSSTSSSSGTSSEEEEGTSTKQAAVESSTKHTPGLPSETPSVRNLPKPQTVVPGPTPPTQRKIKLKNVPLNPKLHRGEITSTPQPILPKTSSITPPTINSSPKPPMMSNRDIFGQSKPNIPNIPIGLSGTSILPTSISAGSSPANSQKILNKPKPIVKRRSSDKQQQRSANNSLSKPSPSTSSNVDMKNVGMKNQRQTNTTAAESKLSPTPNSMPVIKPKKATKPRVSSVVKNSTPPTKTQGRPQGNTLTLTPEQQLQTMQQLQLAQLTSFGLGQLLQPMPMLQPAPKLQSSINSNQQKKTSINPTRGGLGYTEKSSKESESYAAAMMQTLASLQSQNGPNLSVTEVKKTKPTIPSPVTSSMSTTIVPRSSNSPGQGSSKQRTVVSPNNFGRMPPMPNSNSMTLSSSSSTIVKTQNQPPTPPIYSTNNIQHKSYTPFDVSALLAKPISKNNYNESPTKQ